MLNQSLSSPLRLIILAVSVCQHTRTGLNLNKTVSWSNTATGIF